MDIVLCVTSLQWEIQCDFGNFENDFEVGVLSTGRRFELIVSNLKRIFYTGFVKKINKLNFIYLYTVGQNKCNWGLVEMTVSSAKNGVPFF